MSGLYPVWKIPMSIPWIFLFFSSCCQGVKDPAFEDVRAECIPRLDSVEIDGDPGEWPGTYNPVRIFSDVFGKVPDPSDLTARFRLAWNPESLLILAEMQDDTLYEDREEFWNGDGMELFLSPRPGSFDIIQLSVRPAFERNGAGSEVKFYDHRKTDTLEGIPPDFLFCSGRSGGTYFLEGRISLAGLGMTDPVEGSGLGFQVYLNDYDREKDSLHYSLPWFPVRDSYRNPYAMQSLVFTDSLTPAPVPEVRAFIEDERFLVIKLITGQFENSKNLFVQSGHLKHPLKLRPAEYNLYSSSWRTSLQRQRTGSDYSFFLRDNILFLQLPICMMHRSWIDLPEPNRFEDEVRLFEILDHYVPPPGNACLFTGSSTIARWFDLESSFPGLPVLNRGFGGSTMNDLNFYRDRIVFPYDPVKIIVYEGDNDIARGASPSEFLEACREFVLACGSRIPGTQIIFLSIKPSPARIKDWQRMKEANRLLKAFAEKHENVLFIDITRDLIKSDGNPKEDIFEADRLHFNKAGYEILSRAISPVLYEQAPEVK